MIMSSRKLVLVILVLVVALVIASVYIFSPFHEVRVRISTTTSLYATGLLDYLADQFKKENPRVRLEYIAVGTGAALKYAEQGDACAVTVHAPSLEKQYLERGVLEPGIIFAYNFFIIVGPRTDPAGISNSSNVIDAFKKIYSAGESGKTAFISRGDNSGTHVKELDIWKKVNLNPADKSWYKEAATGMEQTLVVANELQAYTLSDIGTYLKFKKAGKLPNLEILYANSTDLNTINIYSAYLVKKCSGEERKYAELFIRFLENRQDIIGGFGLSEYGQPLFYPVKDKMKEIQTLWVKLSAE